MSNLEISAQLVVENLLEQNKVLVLEVAKLRAAVTQLSKEIQETQIAEQGEQNNE